MMLLVLIVRSDALSDQCALDFWVGLQAGPEIGLREELVQIVSGKLRHLRILRCQSTAKDLDHMRQAALFLGYKSLQLILVSLQSFVP